MIENNQIGEIPKDQLSKIQDQQQQIRDEQLQQRENEQQEQPLPENEQIQELLIEQQPPIHEQLQDASQQQQQDRHQIPQALERPQRQYEQQQEEQKQHQEHQQLIPQVLEGPQRQNEQEHQIHEVQRSLSRNEQRPLQPSEQQLIGAEQISDEQQQRQQQQIPQRQEQNEQEPQIIPDAVRQMPDAEQQEMLKEILKEFQLQRQELQQLHQSQRIPKSNNAILIPIIVSIVAAIAIALLLRTPMDYVPRHEFETYKTDSQNGLVAVRENSRKSISDQEAKMVKFGKHWEEYLKNMMKPNATTPELPDYSIANLLEADRKIQAENFKLKTDLSNLQIEVASLQNVNTQLKKSLDNVKARLQKIESMNERGWWYNVENSFRKDVIMIIISIVLTIITLFTGIFLIEKISKHR